MGKFANDLVMDAALDNIIAAGNLAGSLLCVCAGQPTTYASAVAQGAQMLARHKVSTGDFTKADGDANGRKVTIAQQTSIPVSASGGANHVVLVTGSTIHYITTATSQTLTAGNTLTINAFDIEIADPT